MVRDIDSLLLTMRNLDCFAAAPHDDGRTPCAARICTDTAVVI